MSPGSLTQIRHEKYPRRPRTPPQRRRGKCSSRMTAMCTRDESRNPSWTPSTHRTAAAGDSYYTAARFAGDWTFIPRLDSERCVLNPKQLGADPTADAHQRELDNPSTRVVDLMLYLRRLCSQRPGSLFRPPPGGGWRSTALDLPF